MKKLRVLFLCTGNSCRSQMAEGWARHLKGDCLEPMSAGLETHGLNPWAVKAMEEKGVDISSQHSQNLQDFCGSEVGLRGDGMRPRSRDLPPLSRECNIDPPWICRPTSVSSGGQR